MNKVVVDNKEYFVINRWKSGVDIEGLPFPKPVPVSKHWVDKNKFINKLSWVENILKCTGKFESNKKKSQCKLCKKKSITTGKFVLNRIVWDDGLVHYIKKHNIYPGSFMIDFVMNLIDSKELLKKNIKIKCEEQMRYGSRYIKITRNQLLVLDILMKSGSKKIYYHGDKTKYSEQSGYFEIDKNNLTLKSISIDASAKRIDTADSEIFLPSSETDLSKHKIVFHTHPETPELGSRVANGVLYEFPSSGDIFHFIDNNINGNVDFSVIMAPEGIYIIRKIGKLEFSQELYKLYNSVAFSIQKEYIKKYDACKLPIDREYFYSTISQDTSCIHKLNKFLKDFNIIIDYYPRNKIENKWIVDTIYIKLD